LGYDNLEGKYANYFKIGHNEDVFVLDYYQLFPDDDCEDSTLPLQDSPKVRIIISPSDANQLLAHLKSAIDEYEHSKKNKAQRKPEKNKHQ